MASLIRMLMTIMMGVMMTITMMIIIELDHYFSFDTFIAPLEFTLSLNYFKIIAANAHICAEEEEMPKEIFTRPHLHPFMQGARSVHILRSNYHHHQFHS